PARNRRPLLTPPHRVGRWPAKPAGGARVSARNRLPVLTPPHRVGRWPAKPAGGARVSARKDEPKWPCIAILTCRSMRRNGKKRGKGKFRQPLRPPSPPTTLAA